MAKLTKSGIVRERRPGGARAEHEVSANLNWSCSFNVDRWNGGDRREAEGIPGHPGIMRRTSEFETLRLVIMFDRAEDERQVVLNLRGADCQRLMRTLQAATCRTCNGHGDVYLEGGWSTHRCPSCGNGERQ